MSDTPRTDAEEYTQDDSVPPEPLGLVDASFARALERELTSAQSKIKRLEDAGDELLYCASQIGWTSSESPKWIRKAELAVKAWTKEREVQL